jgi:zinc transporter, ZIP family
VLATALVFSLVPVVAAALSGGAAAVRAPGPRVTSGLQHFAAGVVFAAAAIELLPGVLNESPWVAVAGFPLGLVAAIAVDFFIDGLILGAGFAAGGHTGVLLTIALAVEYLFVGLSLSATLAGSVRKRVVAIAPVLLAVLTVLGTVLGAVVLAGVSASVLAGVLAFGAVAFMYLATEELLVQAHVRGETSLGSVGFFVGFLIYLVLHELIR